MFNPVNPKQSFPELEQNIINFWKQEKTFEKSVTSRPEEKPYRFYDWPPFITWMPHYWHLLASTIKDIVPRYQTMLGKRVERVWWWDCHWIAVEEKVMKKLGLNSNREIEEKIWVEKFIEECYIYTNEISWEWEWYIDHIWRWVDLENAYKTMDKNYMESVMWTFKQMYDKWLVYKWKRISHYSVKLWTPISNFEVAMDDSYEEVKDPAVTVKVKVKDFFDNDNYRESTWIVVRNEKWQVLLWKKKKNWLLTFCWGEVEKWETPLAWAKRELFEESWIKVDDLKLMYTDTNYNKGQHWKAYVYELTVGNDFIPENPESDKFEHWKFYDVNDLEVNKDKMENHSYTALKKARGDETIFTNHNDIWVYLLIWTTTPRTLPTNVATAVNKDNDYVLVNFEAERYILAKNRVETVFKWKWEYEIMDEFKWSELVWLSYEPIFPFYKWIAPEDKNFKVYHADFITDTDWTWIWHEAPEFWEVDFELWKANWLYQTESIDDECKYNNQVPDYKWIYVRDANEAIMERLKVEWKLFKKESITHRVAVCPRTQIPLIYRTQDAWFLDIQSMKWKLLSENQKINWYPEHLKNWRFAKNIETAPDWCLSRKRYWATPVPMWTCASCGEIHVFWSIEEIEKAWDVKINDLHKPYVDNIEITCRKCSWVAKRISEVLDVWMESWSMSLSQFHYPLENKDNFEKAYPADFIVEYIGQIRAWFYVMHVVWVTLFGKNAFNNVITTWVIAWNDWRKMSKSYWNFTDPKILLTKYGWDATRFYMASSPVVKWEDMNFSDAWVEEVVKKVILPLWNTYSFFTTYANIDKFEPEKNGNIFYVRHGQTQNNAEGRMNWWEVDSLLNETWELQALEAWEKFALTWEKLDKIYVSPRLRTKKTAELIASKLWYEVEVIEDVRLLEQDAWKFSWMTHAEIMKITWTKTKYDMRRAYKETNWVEDIETFEKRVVEVFWEIEAEKNTWKNILIVAHAWTFRPINRYLNNLTKDEAHFNWDSIWNAIIVKLPNYKKSNPLDRWIISELHNLTSEIRNALDNYRLNEWAKPVMKFIDNLTNWYIRRSRKRFWWGWMNEDKISAYNTLYEVLVETCKIIAPYMPFVSEQIFKDLTWKESVHLEMFPEVNKAFIFEKLNDDMAETKDIITLWLAARANAKIRVRQPLSYVKISKSLDKYYTDIIKEELNIKEVRVFEESELPQKICKPNARLIGPKFGKDVKFIISEAKAWNFEELNDGKVKVWEFVIDEGEFEIEFSASQNTSNENEAIENWNWIVVAINKEITKELKEEWYIRDIVRHIQESRKEANYQVDDRIKVELEVKNCELIINEKLKNYIESETLSSLVENIENADLEKELEIDNFLVKLKLKK